MTIFFDRSTGDDAAVRDSFARRHRLYPFEAMPWIVAVIAFFAFSDYLALMAQILATIVFALSVDLALGYAGMVTLGHAAFFGIGAYTAGLLAENGWVDAAQANAGGGSHALRACEQSEPTHRRRRWPPRHAGLADIWRVQV